MNCNKAQEMISLYIDNKLSSQSVSELKKHFTECSKCKQDYITLKNIKMILSNSPKKELSSNFTASVMNKIKNKEYGEKKDNVIMFGSFFNSMKKKIVMAAGFLFVVASSYFFFMPHNNINKQNNEIYTSAIEYYFASDNYNQNDIDNDDYEEYILSIFC